MRSVAFLMPTELFTGKEAVVFKTLLRWFGIARSMAGNDSAGDLALEARIICARVRQAGEGRGDPAEIRYSRRNAAVSGAAASAAVQLPESLIRHVESAKTFSRQLAELIAVHCGGVASVCYVRAGVRRQTFSKIMSNGGEHVSKRIALQLCIGARASGREADEILKSAGYAFCDSSYEDAVFKWCLENEKYDMIHVNELLVRCSINGAFDITGIGVHH